MLTGRTESIAAVAMILKSILNIIIFAFSLWIIYFSGNSSYSLLQGALVFIALSLIIGILSQIPFGLVFAPLLVEWWWLDIELSGISAIAWSLVVASMILDGLLFGLIVRNSSTEGR